MKTFLSSCKKDLPSRLAGKEKIHVVLGNESCDLDSVLKSNSADDVFFPVLNVAAVDLELRTEICFHLAENGLEDHSQFIFRDQVDLEQLHKDKRLALTLVDHNAMSMSQHHWEEDVEDIIDHHKDDGGCKNASRRNIVFPQGSCASLVALELHKNGKFLDKEVARLLLGPILIDTANLEMSFGKTEKYDREMSKVLTELVGLSEEERNVFYESINKAKYAVEHLSPYDNLRKDYKEWKLGEHKVGISAVLLDARHFEREKTFSESMEKWLSDRELDVLLVMTGYFDKDKGFSRQILLFTLTKDVELFESIDKFLESEACASLDLECLKEIKGEKNNLKGWQQKNIKASRKQVQPLLSGFLGK